MSRLSLFLVLWLAALKAIAAEPSAGTMSDGATFRGALTALEPDWKLRFSGGEKAELSAGDLAYWGSFATPLPGAQLMLAGGGVIVVDTVRIEKELAAGQSSSLGAVSLPIEMLAAVMLHSPSDRAAYDRLLLRLTALDSQMDRLLLDNGDELTGTILGLDEKAVQLESGGGKLNVETDKITALAFNATLVRQPRLTGLRMLVGLRDGSRVTAVALSSQLSQVRLKLAGGAELTTPVEAIVALQTLGGLSQYLSDLAPASYKHLPYLSLTWPYRNDRSVSGGPLRAGGRLLAKGLGMHSPARITYDLPASVQRFDAEVAIDAEAGQRGSVVFRVFVDDGSGAWQERLATPIVRGDQPPLPVTADVSGAKRISLLVDYADRGDELDHADWLNARVSP
jgi:hypothetical protein